ncbi:GDT1-like protein 1, chloroplastic isoform X1 [Zingiber officinale]|uniref:GDT1-like protein 1, chloroplastic isoform X1 n=1 Tax=Zingiber officinale TaxID=94328 RepID=UPI001C4CE796|nr:GDT1-like protein 1, chloroplastic isoform X1 [Zingiber officinale]
MACCCRFTKGLLPHPFFISDFPRPLSFTSVPRSCRFSHALPRCDRRSSLRRPTFSRSSGKFSIPEDGGQQGLDDYSGRPNLDSIHHTHMMEKALGDIPTKGRSTNVRRALEFTFLLGLFTFQASQQAIAGTELAGLQPMTYLGDLGDISTGFASAFLLIFFSELGDKTFFIAALLAARNSGVIVFIGTFGALATMSIVSVILGRTFHYIDDALPFRFGGTDFPIDDFAAVCLLVYFGVTTLLDAASDDGQQSTDEQKEAELAISEFSGDGAGIMAAASTVISTFILVFVAEWGDKSFFSTIALAAASSPLGVIGGALVGHAFATLLAVLGGSFLGTFVSEKVIAYVGGVLFLVFAVVTLIEIFI